MTKTLCFFLILIFFISPNVLSTYAEEEKFINQALQALESEQREMDIDDQRHMDELFQHFSGLKFKDIFLYINYNFEIIRLKKYISVTREYLAFLDSSIKTNFNEELLKLLEEQVKTLEDDLQQVSEKKEDKSFERKHVNQLKGLISKISKEKSFDNINQHLRNSRYFLASTPHLYKSLVILTEQRVKELKTQIEASDYKIKLRMSQLRNSSTRHNGIYNQGLAPLEKKLREARILSLENSRGRQSFEVYQKSCRKLVYTMSNN